MSAKSRRFSAASRIGAACLVFLLLAANPAPAGIDIHIKIGWDSSKLAKQLAEEMDRVRQKFKDDRAALPIVPGPGGVPAYPRQAVVDLVNSAERELDHAVEQVKEPKLAGLRAWGDEQIEISRRKLERPATLAAAAFSGPRPVALFASFAGGAKHKPQTPKPSPKADPPPQPVGPPKPDPLEATTVGTTETQQILGQVEKAIERIFFLADKDDLEVKLWIGSTPAQHATFRFWPKSSAQGAPPAPTIIQTDGQKDHVLRGIYDYRASAALGSKAVTTILENGPKPAGGAPSLTSERLDLVNGSRFFCCRFDDNYCHHVDDEKECQPERR
ncbi:MAG TPA: hypothetical protein VFE33_09280 [Thermoanaerobaculia bacterium]|nr:hypothetical protein [Thermoanaerobaculia bacterium]